MNTEAKLDFFAGTPPPLQADARDPLETWFFAILPPPAQAERATQIAQAAQQRHAFRSRIMAPERMHVTLAVAGQATRLRASLDVSLSRAAAAVKFEPFPVAFDHAKGFPTGDKACYVLGCDAASTPRLQALNTALMQGLHAQGIKPLRGGPLKPHLTLMYGTHHAPPAEAIAPIAWHVDCFFLIRSLHGQGHYLIEGEWRAA